MRRREFITLLGGAATWPIAGHAQQPDRMRLVGVLEGYFAESDSAAQSNIAVFRDTLAKLGWTEGSNLRIELRWSAGLRLGPTRRPPRRRLLSSIPMRQLGKLRAGSNAGAIQRQMGRRLATS